MKKKKVYLTLQNSDVFQGYAFGAAGEITGELVFSTNMVGYVETLTDPCNYGQIVVQTFPLIGNYGVMRADAESKKAWVSAFVVREFCEHPSNFRCEEELDAYLKEQGVIGVYGIDTRQLTKIIREDGVMTARISEKPLSFEELEDLADYEITGAIDVVVDKEKGFFASENAQYTVALWNFGAKRSTIDNLLAKGCNVISMPASTTAEEIIASGAHGVVLSDGPGAPEENKEIIQEVKKLMGKKPVMGIGLGHQLVALAFGAETAKQKYGHRGGNQPVKCVKTGKVYITSQNHGYEVITDTIKQGEVSFVNVNDQSCEGINYPDFQAFTVQFTPESCGVGHPENVLYNQFFAMMEKEKENA